VDDVKSYDLETKTFTIENALGFGDDLVKGTLITPLNVKVGQGYQKVAEFEITSYEDYTNLIKSFELQDLNNYKKNIERQIDIKYLTDVEYESPIYKKVCSKTGNGTFCVNEIIDYETKIKKDWVNLDKTDFKKDETRLIGLFTNVQKGDNVEWIPTISTGKGFEIKEWASWTESLNAD